MTLARSPNGMLDVEKARRYLAQSTDLEQIKQLRDKAEAITRYKRAQGAADESMARASVIARAAERRIGELLEAMPKNVGARAGGKKATPRGSVVEPRDSTPTLRDHGISKGQSHRYQTEASVSERDFDKLAEESIKKRKPLTANTLLGVAKLKQKVELAAELNARPVPTPEGRFHVIVIDPPWQYGARAEDTTHRGRNPYPDMPLEAIKALPVGERAEDNCVLWLWTTNAFMRAAYECLDAWGFAEKTILTWAKDRMGTGDWLRGQTEHCVMAIRGRPTVLLTNQTTLLNAPLREHSRKPDEFYALVEALCPGTKLEMFAREPRAGWRAWGAEDTKFERKSA